MSTNFPAVVFLDQEYNYRNAWVALFLAIFGSLAGLMICGLIVKLLAFHVDLAAGKAAWWEPLLWIVIIMPFTGFAGHLAWLFCWRPRWRVRIDDRGITFGNQHFAWERVAWIGFRPSGNILHWHFGYYPVFHLRSRWPLVAQRGLPLSPTLTAEQAEELLDRLEEYLEDKFPDVEVS